MEAKEPEQIRNEQAHAYYGVVLSDPVGNLGGLVGNWGLGELSDSWRDIAMPSLAHIHDAGHAQRECKWWGSSTLSL